MSFDIRQNCRRIILTVLIAIGCPPAIAQESHTFGAELVPVDYKLVRTERISRTVFEYEYVPSVRNDGSHVQAASAKVASVSPHTTVIDGDVAFGDVAAATTARGADTIVLRHDRSFLFNWSDIAWSFSFEVPNGSTAWIGSSGGRLTDSGGAGIEIPPGALARDRMVSLKVHPAPKLIAAPRPDFIASLSVGPTGLRFERAVTLTFPLDTSAAPGSSLPVWTLDEGANIWRRSGEARVNLDGRSASVGVEHFSRFGIERVGSCAFSLAGAWHVTEVADERDCEEGINTYTAMAQATQDNGFVKFTAAEGSAHATKNGCQLTAYGTEVEDEGRSYGNGSLSIQLDGTRMEGSGEWTWVSPEPGQTCSGTSTMVFERKPECTPRGGAYKVNVGLADTTYRIDHTLDRIQLTLRRYEHLPDYVNPGATEVDFPLKRPRGSWSLGQVNANWGDRKCVWLDQINFDWIQSAVVYLASDYSEGSECYKFTRSHEEAHVQQVKDIVTKHAELLRQRLAGDPSIPSGDIPIAVDDPHEVDELISRKIVQEGNFQHKQLNDELVAFVQDYENNPLHTKEFENTTDRLCGG
jgi:hypothetical protein